MKAIFFAALIASLGLSGCGKKAAPPPAPARADPGGVSLESRLSAGAVQAPPVPAGSASASIPTELPEQEKSLKDLTAAVQTYMQVSSDYPKDLNDLVKIKILKKMPTPPPGKRFVIDRKNICVVLADK